MLDVHYYDLHLTLDILHHQQMEINPFSRVVKYLNTLILNVKLKDIS